MSDGKLSTESKILACLCYFSVFFAPILFPAVIWIFTSRPVSHHAKKSLYYHIIPLVLFTCAAIAFSINQNYSSDIAFYTAILLVIITLYYVVVNLYSGIKVLLG